MYDGRGFIFIDGPVLFSKHAELLRGNKIAKESKINVPALCEAANKVTRRYSPVLVRTTLYFKKNESRVKTLLDFPSAKDHHKKFHWQIIECGETASSIPESELAKIDEKYRDQFQRTEKGVDMRLACDALSLIATGKASDFFFLTKDRDFVPVFEAVQRLGGNTYLIVFEKDSTPPESLFELSDAVLTLDPHMPSIFTDWITPKEKV